MGRILVTGSSGYIGRVLVRRLQEQGFTVIAVDRNPFDHKVITDVETRLLDCLYIPHDIHHDSYDAIVHLAAEDLILPGQEYPERYYLNNVAKLQAVLHDRIRNKPFIFASSAAVYHPRFPGVVSPRTVYGRTKLQGEEFLLDMKRANPDFKLAILRFFNVVGGHEELGQPVDQPHVLTSMLRAREKSQDFVIQGGNYRTRDGTVVRDYIHVLDVCDHIIDNMMYMPSSNDTIIQDVGTGKGTTLRELFEVFVHTVGKRMQCVEGPRRSFEDPEELIANAKFMGNLEHSSLQNIIVTATKAYEKATTITN